MREILKSDQLLVLAIYHQTDGGIHKIQEKRLLVEFESEYMIYGETLIFVMKGC